MRGEKSLRISIRNIRMFPTQVQLYGRKLFLLFSPIIHENEENFLVSTIEIEMPAENRLQNLLKKQQQKFILKLMF